VSPLDTTRTYTNPTVQRSQLPPSSTLQYQESRRFLHPLLRVQVLPLIHLWLLPQPTILRSVLPRLAILLLRTCLVKPKTSSSQMPRRNLPPSRI
ncbi:hypothetical protein PQX77_009194, partial [Marasmius sp. AFHP31]